MSQHLDHKLIKETNLDLSAMDLLKLRELAYIYGFTLLWCDNN